MAIAPVPFGAQPRDAGNGALTDLVDRAAIVDLTIRYAWALDNRQWSELDHVFTADATAHLTEPLDSRSAIKDRVRRALEPLDFSQHIVANHQIVLEGDRASCRCYLHAQHVRHAAEGSPNYVVAGHYEDQLARTAEGWRITRRELVITWTDGNPSVVRG